MTFKEITDYIFKLKNKNTKIDLSNIELFYKILNSPCDSIKFFHIAGTNGKGSASTFIESILIEADYNIGKFTSPHIVDYNERISFNKKNISNKDVEKYFYIVKEKIDEHDIQLNFFEITFFIMLLHFDNLQPDYIIMETGLGGRLDTTNIIDSFIAIITNISYDHIDILGNTLDKIAFEKAGIIKNNELCIYSDSKIELVKEIEKNTTQSINVLEKYKNAIVTLDTEKLNTMIKFDNKKFTLPLFGKFQSKNFLLAYEISQILNIDDTIIQNALYKMKLNGRFQSISSNPLTILDVAHNIDSINALTYNVSSLFNKDEVIIISSVLLTKDIKAIFSELIKVSDNIFVNSLTNVDKDSTSENIKKLLTTSFNQSDINKITFIDSVSFAYNKALKLIRSNPRLKAIIVTGSFYEVSEFIKYYQ